MPEVFSEKYRASTTPEDAGERTLLVGEDDPIRLSTGHRILHHDGKCSRPHGHNYRVTAEITGHLTEEGWVVDKGVVTDLLREWDHMFVVQAGDPLIEAFERTGDGDAVVVLEHPPTAEVLSLALEEKLEVELPETVTNVSVTVRESSELTTY